MPMLLNSGDLNLDHLVKVQLCYFPCLSYGYTLIFFSLDTVSNLTFYPLF